MGGRESVQQREHEKERERIIVRTGVIGIAANVLLAAFKAAVGLAAHSIAIVLDAVNNISDAASSLVTIIGTKLAGRAPDRKHPFGHGRAEYLTALIIAVLVLYAGLTSLAASVRKILQPQTPAYSAVSLIIVAAAVAVKLLLGRYVKRMGRQAHSDALVNAGKDALLDAVISAATLAAAGIYLFFHISVEAWLGTIISLIIIKSGVEMLRETISRILGEQGDPALARQIRQTVLDYPEVQGAYDLVLNNYGPDTWNGSIHIEVPDTLTADELDLLLRDIQMAVYQRHRVVLTAIGIYSVNTRDPEAAAARERVREIALARPYVLQMHGFYLRQQERSMRFDLVVSLDAPDRGAVFREAVEAVQQAYPEYRLQVIMDTDFSEEAPGTD